MPSNQVFGIHFYFTHGRTKPGTWVKRGIVDKLQLKPMNEVIEQEGPAPGHIARVDVIGAARKLDFTVSLKQTDPLFWQLAFNTEQLSAGSAVNFNPNGGGLVIGWAKFQAYDQSDVLRVNVEQLCSIEMPGGVTLGGKQITTGDLEGKVINDPLNVGSLTDLI